MTSDSALFAPVPVAVNTVAAHYGRKVVVHNTSWRLKELECPEKSA